MRPLTAGEISILEGTEYAVHEQIWIANGSGTLKNFAALNGENFINRTYSTEDIDQSAQTLVVELRRDIGALSLSPLREDSALNRLDDGTTYSPAVDAHREIIRLTATVPLGATPSSGDWKEKFRGRIDEFDAASSTMVLYSRDQAGVLMDRFIEIPSDFFGDPGIPLEEAIQLLLDQAAEGGESVQLYTPTPTLYEVGQWNQVGEPVMEAALRLARGFNGWDLRYKWDEGTESFRLTFYDPDRTKTVADWTFGPDGYFDLHRLAIDKRPIRNVISISHPVGTTGRATQDRADFTSFTRFGRRFLGIVEGDDSPIKTVDAAVGMIEAILSDLKDPKAEVEVEMPYFWPVELHDLIEFTANDRHFDTSQFFAVVGIRHDLSNTKLRTTLTLRGTPAGAYMGWRQSFTGREPVELRIKNFREIARTATTITQGWNTPAAELWLYLETKTQPVVGDPWADLTGVPFKRLTGDTTEYVFDIPKTGTIDYCRLVPFDADGHAGRAWDFTIQPNDAVPEISLPIQTVAASGLTSDLKFTVSDPAGLGGTLSVWVNKAGSDDANSAAVADGTKSVDSTDPPFVADHNTVFALTAGGTGNLLDDIKVHASRGKRVFAEFTNSDGISSGKQTILLQPGKPPTDEDGTLDLGDSLAAALADAEEIISEAALMQRSVGTLQLKLAGVERENVALAAIDAARTDIAELSDITTDIGAMVAGRLDNLPASAFINLEATGSQPVIGHPKFALLANGDATFAGALTAATGTFAGSLSAVTGTFGGSLTATTVFATGIVTNNAVALGTLTANRLAISELSEIADDAGILVSGELRNAAGTRYINLDATGAQPFIAHEKFEIRADGTAIFTGQLIAATGTFTGSLSSVDGTFTGELVGASGTFGVITAGTISANIVKLKAAGGTPGLSSVHAFFDGTNTITGGDSAGLVKLQRTTPGTTPTNALLCTVTFAAAYGSRPFIVLGGDSFVSQADLFIANASATGFDVRSLGVGVATPGSTFEISYLVIG